MAKNRRRLLAREQENSTELSLWTRNDPTVQALIRQGYPLTKRAYAEMEWHQAYEKLGPELLALIPEDLPEGPGADVLALRKPAGSSSVSMG